MQRIPPNEKRGRVHTSTVTIAVPVGPGPCVRQDPQQNVGFLVHVTGDGTHHFAGDDVPRLREALAALRADAQQ